VRLDPLALLLLVTLGCRSTTESEVSQTLRVNPKPGEVWGRDLAAGLGLLESEVCRELGTSDCIAEAHRITLGGVEPERLGIDEPLSNALVSAPIAVDRVAQAACGERWVRDRKGPAILFGPVLDKDGKKQRKAVSEALVQRLLARHATDADLDALELLHVDLESFSSDLPRDWSIGACVVVATSTEALFY
jgi:hypothetical protein